MRHRPPETLSSSPLYWHSCKSAISSQKTPGIIRALRAVESEQRDKDDLQRSDARWLATMSTHADCRMYESKYPDVDDVVMVQVKSIAEMGAYVSLLEYNGIEGMILLSELSRRRIRSITKLIKVCEQ